MAPETWDVALLGAGRIAARHVRAINGVGALRVRWVVSRTRERAQALADEHGVPHVGTNPQDALADPAVRAVVVAYPTQQHASLTLAAFEAGKHVVCEKPLAWTTDETRTMLAAAERHNLRLAVCHIRRYWSVCTRMREIAATLGIIHQASWSYRVRQHWPETWRTEAPGGYLLDAHVHDLDLLRWFGGHTPQRVYGQGHNRADGHGVLVFSAADEALLRFDWDGAIAGPSYPDGARHRAEVVGEHGWVRLAITGQRMALEHRTATMENVERTEYAVGDVITASWPAMWASFANYLRDGQPPIVTAHDAAVAVEMTLGGIQSLALGQPVALSAL